MRGGLDDALEKLARRNELRRRTAQQPTPTAPPALTELVEAVAAVVSRHPELRVTLGIDGLSAPATVRVWSHDGLAQVSLEAVVAPPQMTTVTVADGTVPADAPAVPTGEPATAPAGARTGTPAAAAYDGVRHPDAGPTFPDVATPPSRTTRSDAVEERTVPLRRPPEPLVIPSSDQAAKRLAALLREDPSLLHGTPPQ